MRNALRAVFSVNMRNELHNDAHEHTHCTHKMAFGVTLWLSPPDPHLFDMTGCVCVCVMFDVLMIADEEQFVSIQ